MPFYLRPLPAVALMALALSAGAFAFASVAENSVDSPVPASTIESLWLQAEASKDDEKMEAWNHVYEAYSGGSVLPEGVSHDVLLLNMIETASKQDEMPLAEELLDQVQDEEKRLYTRLYLLREQALDEDAAKDSLRDEMLTLLPDARTLLKGESYYHWVNALSTALMDSVYQPAQDEDMLNTLLAAQKIGRHRAYLLHRIAAANVGMDQHEAAALAINMPLVEQLLGLGEVNAAYDRIAEAGLSRINPGRNHLLLTLHEQARSIAGQETLALQSLWLIDKDNDQYKALIRYIEWLINHNKVNEAAQVADSLPEGKPAERAYYRLRDAFKTIGMETAAADYQRRIEAEKARIAPKIIPALQPVVFDPFKRLDRKELLFSQLALREALRLNRLPDTLRYCQASELAAGDAGLPVTGFKAQPDKGVDRRAQAFSWFVMVEAGRAIAGDAQAIASLKDILLRYARANAFGESEPTHQAYFSLKRVLLPVIVASAVIAPDMPPEEWQTLTGWLLPLVQKTDMMFDGEVDRNNHRYMADAVQMAWGILANDPRFYHKGIERFHDALHQMQPDGSLPLETRRGSRAVWYMRQSLASLTAIAEMARLQGDNVFAAQKEGRKLEHMLAYMLNTAFNPLIILPQAAANYTPGPDYNIFHMDTSMMQRRGHGRHYLAFAEIWLAHQQGFTVERLRQWVNANNSEERPLMDEFSGGNLTCFSYRQ